MIARWSAAVAAVLLTGLLSPAAAPAQHGVTVAVRPALPAYGTSMTITGQVSPAAAEPVSVALDGRVIATGRSRPDGSYALTAVARAPGTLVATTAGDSSPPVRLRIRPRLHARMTGLRILGSPLRLRGTLRPATAGRLRAFIGGRERSLPLNAAGAFTVPVPSRQAGRVCAQLTLAPAAGFTRLTARRCAIVGTPQLRVGAGGAAVRFLQARLSRLHYALLGITGRFGADTRDAVYAFQKVERLTRDGIAGAALWRRLAVARTPSAARAGTHIEVDKARQVLFEVVAGRVRLVAHVSTGATGNTPVGTWRIYAKTPGINSLGMLDSMYFLRGFAVHGYASVPPYPASHGCVRVPMWLAPHLYSRWPVGATIVVLGR